VCLLRSALNPCSLSQDHDELKVKYEKARVLLSAELGYEPGPLRRSDIAAILGDGYSDLYGRTVRRHTANVVSSIRLHAGDDFTKQRQLAEAVLASIHGSKTTLTQQEADQFERQEFVMDGVREMFGLFAASRGEAGAVSRHGRYKHETQVARQTLMATVVSKVPQGKVAAVARMLEINEKELRSARPLFQEYESGARTVPYDLHNTSCNRYPDAYEECVKEMWVREG